MRYITPGRPQRARPARAYAQNIYLVLDPTYDPNPRPAPPPQPSLKELTIAGAWHLCRPENACAPASKGLRDLGLLRCSLSAESFSRVLAGSPRLRRLAYTAAGHHIRATGRPLPQFSPLEAAAALSQHAPRLRELSLCFASAHRAAHPPAGLLGPATGGTLVTLAKLRVLTLDLRCVLPNLDAHCALEEAAPTPRAALLVHVLPRSIEALTLVWDGEGRIDLAPLERPLTKLVRDAPLTFRRLREVTVQTGGENGRKPWPNSWVLEEWFQQRGIAFKLV